MAPATTTVSVVHGSCTSVPVQPESVRCSLSRRSTASCSTISLGDESRATAAYERSVDLSRRDLETNPRDAGSMALLAVAEAKLGRLAAAVKHAQAAVEISPTSADVIYRQAVVLTQARRFD